MIGFIVFTFIALFVAAAATCMAYFILAMGSDRIGAGSRIIVTLVPIAVLVVLFWSRADYNDRSRQAHHQITTAHPSWKNVDITVGLISNTGSLIWDDGSKRCETDLTYVNDQWGVSSDPRDVSCVQITR